MLNEHKMRELKSKCFELVSLFEGKVPVKTQEILDFIYFMNLDYFESDGMKPQIENIFENHYAPKIENTFEVIDSIFKYNLLNPNNEIKVSCGLIDKSNLYKYSMDDIQRGVFSLLHNVKVGDNVNSIVNSKTFRKLFDYVINSRSETIVPNESNSTKIINNGMIFCSLHKLSCIDNFGMYKGVAEKTLNMYFDKLIQPTEKVYSKNLAAKKSS